MILKIKSKLAIVALIVIMASISSCKDKLHLYEAILANTQCYICTPEVYEIGSDNAYNIGDSVIVDETNFVDMNNTDGHIYIITTDNGTINK